MKSYNLIGFETAENTVKIVANIKFAYNNI
jgi:hypothetical protein